MGSDQVYFQPPKNLAMEYPAIVYDLDPGWTSFANDRPYFYKQQYQVKLIGRSPQPEKFHQLAHLPMSVHDRSYVSDNLRHDVFNIYF